MILIDSSAWVEYLRATGSETAVAVRGLLQARAEIVTTDVVVMEVLAGARSDEEVEALRQLVYRDRTFVGVEGPADYEAAAGLFRACRAGGETIRRLTDCLIAVVAMRARVGVLHRDRDFDAIARHSPLQVL